MINVIEIPLGVLFIEINLKELTINWEHSFTVNLFKINNQWQSINE